jgi:hypothetical protein
MLLKFGNKRGNGTDYEQLSSATCLATGREFTERQPPNILVIAKN